MKRYQSNNPIIKGKGVCDPHVHIFNGKAYLYASHDHAPDNADYRMKDWQIWSSADLVSWELESAVRPEDSYIGASENCWAVDAAERDGKFYLYCSNFKTDTAVFVSTDPGKGFVPASDKPVIYEGLTPTFHYDPGVFTDDDGAAYIVFGAPTWVGADSYYFAKLNPDMISLAEPPRKVILDDGADDKPYIHKHNGVYYLSWASFYATSDNVYGPYATRGSVCASEDHGNFFTRNNQWFNAFTIFDQTLYHRATGLCYVHYRKNGEMVTDGVIVEYGVGQYDAAWNKIEAEWFMSATDEIRKEENARRGFDVTRVTAKSRLCYPNVRGIPENAGMMFFAANHNEAPAYIIVKDGGGAELGRCEITPTWTWDWPGYRTFTCRLKNPPGDSDIWLTFEGEGEDLLHLDYFRFFDAEGV